MPIYPEINRVSENTLIVYFSDEIDQSLPTTIAGLVQQITQWPEGYIVDLTPSYTSLLITFNPALINYEKLLIKLDLAIKNGERLNTSEQSKLVEIPVYYSPQSGLDLEDTARLIGVSNEKLIQMHSAPEYLVFALGFMPGFAFMGIVDTALQLPRLSSPRAKVPVGSVAIAEKQTAVYPDETPGGWRLLGRSPMKLFDPNLNPPQPYQIGDRIKFTPINKHDYLSLGGQL